MLPRNRLKQGGRAMCCRTSALRELERPVERCRSSSWLGRASILGGVFTWLARLPFNEIEETPDGTIKREKPGDIFDRPSYALGLFNVLLMMSYAHNGYQ